MLRRRAAELPPPIQMCDALTRNLPGEAEDDLWPTAWPTVGGSSSMWQTDFPKSVGTCWSRSPSSTTTTRSPESGSYRPRSGCSSTRSRAARPWRNSTSGLCEQFDQRRVEPNSALGKAISYLLRHWEKLTLFLRVAGAPLDNNICERALKKAIRHRRNSLFYKTPHGAHVGDMFMSLIATCETLRGESLRLPHRAGSPREPCGRESRGLDAVELPRDFGKDGRWPSDDRRKPSRRATLLPGCARRWRSAGKMN